MHYPTPSIRMLRPYKLALPYETFPLTFRHRTSLEDSLQLLMRCIKQEASLCINIFLSLVVYQIFTFIAIIFLKIFQHILLLNSCKRHHNHPCFRLQSLCQCLVKQLLPPPECASSNKVASKITCDQQPQRTVQCRRTVGSMVLLLTKCKR